MIKIILLAVVLGFISCARLDHLYLPPGQQLSQTEAVFKKGAANLNNQYLPPNQRASENLNNQYLPPDQRSSPKLNNQYFPPAQRSPQNPNAQYLPPAQRSYQNINNQYLPPAQRSSQNLNNQYTSPDQRSSQNLNNQYLPPDQRSSQNLNNQYLPPILKSSQFEGYSKEGQNEIPILKFAAKNDGDGTYSYNYETANGISAEEQGNAGGGGTNAHGSFSYTGLDGQQISITYTADENGFVPQGANIPTPPPIPEAILKSLQANADAEAAYGRYKGEGQGYGGYEKITEAPGVYASLRGLIY